MEIELGQAEVGMSAHSEVDLSRWQSLGETVGARNVGVVCMYLLFKAMRLAGSPRKLVWGRQRREE